MSCNDSHFLIDTKKTSHSVRDYIRYIAVKFALKWFNLVSEEINSIIFSPMGFNIKICGDGHLGFPIDKNLFGG